MSKLPFEGIRVADFGWIITAPLGTAWLATMGAEVIKVESKVHPDTLRSGIHGGAIPGEDPAFNCTGGFNSLNYSKYSCCLDMTKPEAQELAYEIIKTSDMVVEAYTAPVVERFGLTFPQLQAIKPDIILVSVSSLGKTGPLKDVTGFGPANQAFASLPSMMGYPGGPPASMGGTWPDYVMGVAMAYLAVAGLYHRKRTGQGIYLDLSMAEAVMDMIPRPAAGLHDERACGTAPGQHGRYGRASQRLTGARAMTSGWPFPFTTRPSGPPSAMLRAIRSGGMTSGSGTSTRGARTAPSWMPSLGSGPCRNQDTASWSSFRRWGFRQARPRTRGSSWTTPNSSTGTSSFEMDNPHTGPRLSMAMQGIFSAIPERQLLPGARLR